MAWDVVYTMTKPLSFADRSDIVGTFDCGVKHQSHHRRTVAMQFTNLTSLVVNKPDLSHNRTAIDLQFQYLPQANMVETGQER